MLMHNLVKRYKTMGLVFVSGILCSVRLSNLDLNVKFVSTNCSCVL